MSTPFKPGDHRRALWAGAVVLVVAVQMAAYFLGVLTPPGELVDADAYTRLVRVEHLHSTGDWFNPAIPRSNPTHPETIQWSRLVDLLLLAGGWLLSPFLGLKQGIFWWGVLFSPLLLALSGPLIAWAARPFLRGRPVFFLVLLFYCQPAILIYSAAGRPDHHALLIFLMILVIGWTLRMLRPSPAPPRFPAWAAAFSQSLALAVSIEALISTGILWLALGILWLRGTPGALRQAVRFSSALLAGCLALVLVSIPPGAWTFTEMDRLSPVYLLLFLCVALFWWLALALENRRQLPVPARFGLATAAGAASLGILVFFCPVFLHGPLAGVDPRAMALWFGFIQEHQPIASHWRELPGGAAIWLAAGIFSLPYLVGRLLLTRRDGHAAFPAWLYFTVGGVLFSLLALYQIRWCTYAQVFLVFPLASMVGWLVELAESRLAPPRDRLARSCILVFFAAGYLPLGLGLGRLLAPGSPSPAHPSPSPVLTAPGTADSRELCQWLGERFPRTERILAFLDHGTEILYRTHHEVIATSNHRNAEGMLFLYDTLNSRTDGEALARLESRHITLLVLEFSPAEEGFVLQDPGWDRGNGVFYSRLEQGRAPDWLVPVPTPPAWKQAWHVYRVVYPSDAGASPPDGASASGSPSGALAATAKM